MLRRYLVKDVPKQKREHQDHKSVEEEEHCAIVVHGDNCGKVNADKVLVFFLKKVAEAHHQ